MAFPPLAVGGETCANEAHATTYMFRNIPRSYTSWELLAELEPHVTSEAYDFVYCPWDKVGKSNMGYGFVNFLSPEVGAMVCRAMDGKPWTVAKSSRIMRVLPAHVQGLVPNLTRYCSNNSGAKIDFFHCPVVFHDGRPMTLQEAVALHVPEAADGQSVWTTCSVPAMAHAPMDADAQAGTSAEAGPSPVAAGAPAGPEIFDDSDCEEQRGTFAAMAPARLSASATGFGSPLLWFDDHVDDATFGTSSPPAGSSTPRSWGGVVGDSPPPWAMSESFGFDMPRMPDEQSGWRLPMESGFEAANACRPFVALSDARAAWGVGGTCHMRRAPAPGPAQAAQSPPGNLPAGAPYVERQVPQPLAKVQDAMNLDAYTAAWSKVNCLIAQLQQHV